MSIKSSQVILVSLPLIVAMAIPAFAQANGNLTQKGAVNAIELSQKPDLAKGAKGGVCSGGACAARHAAFQGKGLNGRRMAFHHHRSSFTSLRGEYALSPDQLEKMLTFKTQAREEAQPKVADLISSTRKMRDLLTQPNVDKGQVMNLEGQINSDKAALGNIRVETKLNELSVLTPQQRQELRNEFVKRSVEFGKG
jgi:Spy/CpxP family protein refolding chaperone